MEAVERVEIPMRELAELLCAQMDAGAEAALTVTGYSMLPMLHDRRDRVWLTRLDRVPKRGDVLLYRRENGQYVLHRVIRPEGSEQCLCCGDNDSRAELVKHADILGVVSRFSRKEAVYSVRKRSYRLYVFVWTGLFPVRRPLLWVRRKLGTWRRRCQEKK